MGKEGDRCKKLSDDRQTLRKKVRLGEGKSCTIPTS